MKVQGQERVYMPQMDGDLTQYFWNKKASQDQAMKIVHIVAQSIACIVKNGFNYFDVKAENIGYQLDHDELCIFMLDLGSLTKQLEPGEKEPIEERIPLEFTKWLMRYHIRVIIDHESTHLLHALLLYFLYHTLCRSDEQHHGGMADGVFKKNARFHLEINLWHENEIKKKPERPTTELGIIAQACRAQLHQKMVDFFDGMNKMKLDDLQPKNL